MFGAAHSLTGEQVVILDPQWWSRLADLRDLCSADRLVCPVCRQPVWARAGERRRWHFAHKHLSDCPSSHESPELLQARAALYEWLIAKFGATAVQIEKKLDDGDSILPRHFDCTVESPKGTKLAYWVFDRQAKPEEREALGLTATVAGHLLVPLFTTSVMRRNQSPKGVLNLSTTERAFLLRTAYDDLYPHVYGCSGTLHYLDGEQETLTTLRAMSCTEPPQQYSGTEVTTPMSGVSVHGPTGQFVHPTEWDRLKVHLARVAEGRRREEERRQREEQRRRESEERRARELAERQKVWDSIGIRKDVPPSRMRLESDAKSTPSPPADTVPPPQPLSIYDGREAPCELCGAMTPERDWIVFIGKTGLCKCRACMSSGRTPHSP